MIEQFSEKIAVTIKKANPVQTASVEVMTFALAGLINLFLVFFLSLIIGWMTGKFEETTIGLTSFVILRMVSGGYHMSTLERCVMVSTALFISIPYIALLVPKNYSLINILALLIVIFFAPSSSEKTNISRKIRPYLKVISIVIVCSNFIINSPVVALAFLAQSVLLVFKGGEKNEKISIR